MFGLETIEVTRTQEDIHTWIQKNLTFGNGGMIHKTLHR